MTNDIGPSLLSDSLCEKPIKIPLRGYTHREPMEAEKLRERVCCSGFVLAKTHVKSVNTERTRKRGLSMNEQSKKTHRARTLGCK